MIILDSVVEICCERFQRRNLGLWAIHC